MKADCEAAGIAADNRAKPHDFRRTHGTTTTSLGYSREHMNPIQNHAEGGIGSVYDRHSYADEMRRIQDAVADRNMGLVESRTPDNVVELRATA